MSSNEPDWKVFRRDTKAGRLLSRLYGTTENNSLGINYPKLKAKKNDNLEHRSPWNNAPSATKLSHLLEKQKRASSIKVPKVGKTYNEKQQQQHTHKQLTIHAVPKRRTESVCKKIVLDTKALNQSYRPPYQISGEKDKEKLLNEFEREGGKCLPTELTAQPQKKDTKRVDPTKPRGVSVKASIANQIALEIKERRDFQNEMELNCAGDETREAVVEDISKRLRELMKYDPSLARKLMQDGTL